MCRKSRLDFPNGVFSEKEKPRVLFHVIVEAVREYPLLTRDFAPMITRWIFGIATFSGVTVFEQSLTSKALNLFISVPNSDRLRAYCQGDGPCPFSDVDFMRKLGALYLDASRGQAIVERWRKWEQNGKSGKAESERLKFSKRMGNVSQFMKSLKERLTRMFNALSGMDGTLWKGRFVSVLVDDKPNMILANLLARACTGPLDASEALVLPAQGSHAGTQWTSFGLAMGNFKMLADEEMRAHCRAGIQAALNLDSWEKARVKMMRLLALVQNEKPDLNDLVQMVACAKKRGRPILEIDYLAKDTEGTPVLSSLSLPVHLPIPEPPEKKFSLSTFICSSLPMLLHHGVMGTDPDFFKLMEKCSGEKTHSKRIQRWIDYFNLFDWSVFDELILHSS